MKRQAFTLVELLVVIAIIALLMAILMPALRAARDQAYSIVCTSNMKSLASAWYLYQEDCDGKLVGGHVGGKIGGRLIDWVDKPNGSIGEPLEDKKEGIRRGLLWPYVKQIDVYRCPADLRKIKPPHWAFRSYSISGNMAGQERDRTERDLRNYSEIETPALKYVFVEECDPRGWNMGSWLVFKTGSRWIDPPAIFHNKRSCLSFADGHAEKHRWLDKSTMEWCEQALWEPSKFKFWMTVPAGEGEDLRYMQRGYQLWHTTRPFP